MLAAHAERKHHNKLEKLHPIVELGNFKVQKLEEELQQLASSDSPGPVESMSRTWFTPNIGPWNPTRPR